MIFTLCLIYTTEHISALQDISLYNHVFMHLHVDHSCLPGNISIIGSGIHVHKCAVDHALEKSSIFSQIMTFASIIRD